MVTRQWSTVSIKVALVWYWGRETERYWRRQIASACVCVSFLVIAQEHCLCANPVWWGLFHLFLSHPHAPTPTPTESCHTQQKPPKLILTRSRPAHQHTIGIIDQSLTFWWKQGGKEQQSHSLLFFLSFQQTILSSYKFLSLSIAAHVSSLSLWHIISC